MRGLGLWCWWSRLRRFERLQSESVLRLPHPPFPVKRVLLGRSRWWMRTKAVAQHRS